MYNLYIVSYNEALFWYFSCYVLLWHYIGILKFCVYMSYIIYGFHEEDITKYLIQGGLGLLEVKNLSSIPMQQC